MNGRKAKIEIIKPFGDAIELMKKILFQPFDLTKWLVLGFAAFLAHLSGGTGFNFNVGNWNRPGASSSEEAAAAQHLEQLPHWLVPLLVVLVPLILILVFVLMWIGARGRFIFTDCIVRNRAAIVAPWREFKKEANSYFLFSLLVMLVMLVIIVVAFLPMILPVILHGTSAWPGFAFSLGLIFWLMVVFIIAISWMLVSLLMVPVMYRRRCLAFQAFKEVIALISAEPTAIILYLLFLFALSIGIALVACVAICVTCCIAAVPYVGSVILLPIEVFFYAYTLLFLRQFGPDYDVWAGIPQAAPPPVPPPAPPAAPPPPLPA
jgi:hypothetical protein